MKLACPDPRKRRTFLEACGNSECVISANYGLWQVGVPTAA